jgi:predicted lipoprotein with Yx(FWY)xxD motif
MTGKGLRSTIVVLSFLVGGLAISAASAEQTRVSDASARATVKVTQTKKLGRFLVDGKGRTLYLYTGESADSIVCKSNYLSCTKLWPPLLTTGKPRAGAGVNARLLGTVRRTKPAGVQVVYNKHPLYYFASDEKPGDTSGQGYFGIWYVVSPKGNAIKKT